MEVKQFDVYLISLEPIVGHEINRTRPCLIISPNEMNCFISTVIGAPMTVEGKKYPTRVPCVFQGRKGQVVLDQILTIDKERLVTKLGTISSTVQNSILNILQEMFSS
ncbi:MAG: type II toxin-antitoxin system PemK/MazF family toxin [Desulfocapsaceae bacterium]|nr:type II toxin-antitoxin system PemK/MazF family toxin [Desulfocapsaceae bacterium]